MTCIIIQTNYINENLINVYWEGHTYIKDIFLVIFLRWITHCNSVHVSKLVGLERMMALLHN